VGTISANAWGRRRLEPELTELAYHVKRGFDGASPKAVFTIPQGQVKWLVINAAQHLHPRVLQ